uniref:Uncharacterized protein n=1 Tax=Meloidogyne javanica TaxID=6303 RepID=A0A915LMV6_MELJA
MDNEEDKNALKKIDEIEHRANILEKALQEQEEIRTKAEERIEAIKESFWKYLTNFFSSACNVENKGGKIIKNNKLK